MKIVNDLLSVFRVYSYAKKEVALLHDAKEYPGVVRTNMAVNNTRTALENAGVSAVSPAVIFVAVGLAFILNPQKK
jgi:hypothetical protein